MKQAIVNLNFKRAVRMNEHFKILDLAYPEFFRKDEKNSQIIFDIFVQSEKHMIEVSGQEPETIKIEHNLLASVTTALNEFLKQIPNTPEFSLFEILRNDIEELIKA